MISNSNIDDVIRDVARLRIVTSDNPPPASSGVEEQTTTIYRRKPRHLTPAQQAEMIALLRDPTISDANIARQLGIDPSAVTRAKKRFAHMPGMRRVHDRRGPSSGGWGASGKAGVVRAGDRWSARVGGVSLGHYSTIEEASVACDRFRSTGERPKRNRAAPARPRQARSGWARSGKAGVYQAGRTGRWMARVGTTYLGIHDTVDEANAACEHFRLTGERLRTGRSRPQRAMTGPNLMLALVLQVAVEPGLTGAQLATRLNRSCPYVARGIREGVREGLLQQRPSATDRRVRRVHLGPRGQAWVNDVLASPDAKLDSNSPAPALAEVGG